MKILIIDDELDLVDAITGYLNSEFIVCETAPTYKIAIDKIENESFDCILLDLNLPDANGLDLLSELNANCDKTGVIIISAKAHIEDKVLGLQKGADDYLPKPFDMSELEARLMALIRRLNGCPEIVNFKGGNLIIDDSEMCINGVHISLTPKEMKILKRLIESEGKYVPKDSLYQCACCDNYTECGNVDVVYHHLTNIKKKLQEVGVKNKIKSKYGIGYKWSDK
jgi:DNA-binding response OmpR family regulator